MKKKRAFPNGIYLNKAGTKFRVIWQDGGRNVEHPGGFPLDTPIATMVAFRRLKTKQAAPPRAAQAAGSFARDAEQYLRTREGRPSYKSERSHLKAWLDRFGPRSRFVITPDAIRLMMAEWTDASPKTIRHRLNVLTQVFKLFEPETATPCDRIKRPALHKRRPQGVPDDIIETTALRLAEQERKGKLRNAKTRARFLVQATCGKRPCQMQRARPIDVNFTTRIWDVVPAKYSEGGPLYLNDEMLAAWQAFAQANAWGSFSLDSYRETLRRNGWPEGVRPYNMRHQTLQTMTDRGIDFGAVQQAAGHSSPDTTRRYYVPHQLVTSQRTSTAIDGRFSDDVFAATSRHRTGVRILDPILDRAPLSATPDPATEPPAPPAPIKDFDQGQSSVTLEPSGIVRKNATIPNAPPPSGSAPRLRKKPKNTLIC